MGLAELYRWADMNNACHCSWRKKSSEISGYIRLDRVGCTSINFATFAYSELQSSCVVSIHLALETPQLPRASNKPDCCRISATTSVAMHFKTTWLQIEQKKYFHICSLKFPYGLQFASIKMTAHAVPPGNSHQKSPPAA